MVGNCHWHSVGCRGNVPGGRGIDWVLSLYVGQISVFGSDYVWRHRRGDRLRGNVDGR